VPPGAGYPIEDFLEAITAQLDQTQDALRLKAVNRPLTFALKDFNVDLKVFVEMDQNGRVTFRPAGPNEEGASTVSIGFTTITRPMIEENTISMEMSQAPTLDELGLKREEQRQLAKIGVRNAAQLKTLQRSAGEETLSRHTGIDLLRIRNALSMARPQVEDVVAEPAPKAGRAPVSVEPVTRGPDVVAPGGGKLADRLRQGLVRPRMRSEEGQPIRKLEVAPGAKKIHVAGRNLIEEGRTLAASLDGRPLSLLGATSLAATFALPPGQGGGRLTIELPDGRTEDYDLFEQPGGAR
jgi:hypothetical protein